MQVCKAKGSRAGRCFIQVSLLTCFSTELEQMQGGTMQISSVEQERKLWHVALGTLCCTWRKLDLPDSMRTQVLVVCCF